METSSRSRIDIQIACRLSATRCHHSIAITTCRVHASRQRAVMTIRASFASTTVHVVVMLMTVPCARPVHVPIPSPLAATEGADGTSDAGCTYIHTQSVEGIDHISNMMHPYTCTHMYICHPDPTSLLVIRTASHLMPLSWLPLLLLALSLCAAQQTTSDEFTTTPYLRHTYTPVPIHRYGTCACPCAPHDKSICVHVGMQVVVTCMNVHTYHPLCCQ